MRIGLTGGIAAGKSTASERFAELGARVIDHDHLARRVVEPGSAALVDIVGEFGDRVVKDGALDREMLANIVFADEEARVRLEEIIHPYVRAAASAADKQARAEGVAVIVHDIPLLVETGQGSDFDLVVCVVAPLAVRVARLRESRGLTHEQAMERILAQASDEERAAVCDCELDGSGDVDHLRAGVDEFWASHLP
nr:dephospho-CoA kinase [Demequina sp. TTPB684]